MYYNHPAFFKDDAEVAREEAAVVEADTRLLEEVKVLLFFFHSSLPPFL